MKISHVYVLVIDGKIGIYCFATKYNYSFFLFRIEWQFYTQIKAFVLTTIE